MLTEEMAPLVFRGGETARPEIHEEIGKREMDGSFAIFKDIAERTGRYLYRGGRSGVDRKITLSRFMELMVLPRSRPVRPGTGRR